MTRSRIIKELQVLAKHAAEMEHESFLNDNIGGEEYAAVRIVRDASRHAVRLLQGED